MAEVALVSPEYVGDEVEDDRRYVAVFDWLNSSPGLEGGASHDAPVGTLAVFAKLPLCAVLDGVMLARWIQEDTGVPVKVDVKETWVPWHTS